MNKSRLIEILIFVLSVTGNYFVTQTGMSHQSIGFSIWLIANVIGIFFFCHKKLYIIGLQFFVFSIFSSIGIWNRV